MKKKTYTIVYTETLEHHFEVEANSPEEAKRVFEEKNNNGEFDFSYGGVIDSSIKVKGDNTSKFKEFCDEINKIRGAAVWRNDVNKDAYVECGIIDDDFINAVKKVIHKFDYMVLEERECEGSDYPSYCIWFGERGDNDN